MEELGTILRKAWRSNHSLVHSHRPSTSNDIQSNTLLRLQPSNTRAIFSCSSQHARLCINLQIRPKTFPSRSRFRHPWRWGLRQRNVRLSSLGPLQIIHVDVSKHTTFDCYLANSYFATRMSGGRLDPPRQRCSESFDGQIRIMRLWAQQDRLERVELVRTLLFPYDFTELTIVVVSESCWSLEVDAPSRENFEALKPSEGFYYCS